MWWAMSLVTWRTARVSAIGICSATGDAGESLEAAGAAAAAGGTAAEALWSSPMTFSTHRLTSGSLLCFWLLVVKALLRRALTLVFVPLRFTPSDPL